MIWTILYGQYIRVEKRTMFDRKQPMIDLKRPMFSQEAADVLGKSGQCPRLKIYGRLKYTVLLLKIYDLLA